MMKGAESDSLAGQAFSFTRPGKLDSEFAREIAGRHMTQTQNCDMGHLSGGRSLIDFADQQQQQRNKHTHAEQDFLSFS